MQWGQPWGLAWGALPAASGLGTVPRGSHRLLTSWGGFWSDDALDPDNWTLSGSVAPIVTLIEFVDGDLTQLYFYFDQPFIDGWTYTLTPHVELGGTVPDPVVFVARVVSHPARDVGPELLDIDTGPLEAWGLTPGGDYRLVGGLATLRRIVDDRLLTVRESLSWAPDYGSPFAHKALVPRDLAAVARRVEAVVLGVPYVTEVRATVSYQDRELIVSADIRSTIGELHYERRLW